jgi:hypothetical protein
MGSYTSVVESNVEIVDKEGLNQFLKDLKSGKYPEYVENDKSSSDHGKNIGHYYAKAVKIEGDELDFSGFDGWKIISYYYDGFVMFLRDVAAFVEGSVMLEFETPDESGWFEFIEGTCIIHTGETKWNKPIKAQDMMREKKPMPDYVKQRLCARKI